MLNGGLCGLFPRLVILLKLLLVNLKRPQFFQVFYHFVIDGVNQRYVTTVTRVKVIGVTVPVCQITCFYVTQSCTFRVCDRNFDVMAKAVSVNLPSCFDYQRFEVT